MSETYLRFVPRDRSHAPSEERQRRALELLRDHFPGSEVEATLTETVCFIDPGQNMGAIHCPQCGTRLDHGWWGDAMTAASENAFLDLATTSPCCGRPISLDTLVYEWPVAFGRFVLSVRGPGRVVSEEEIAALGRALGVELCVVVVRI